MSTVRTYKGHDVPEGAVRALGAIFYKVEDGVLLCQSMVSPLDDWEESCWPDLESLDKEVDIEVIAIPQEPETFVPVVGEECEMLITRFEPVMPLFIGDQVIVIEIASAEIAYNIREMDFRPIKTEREKVIESLSGKICHPSVTEFTKEEVIGALYDLGKLINFENDK